MNNSIFEKTMENLRKQKNIIVIPTKKEENIQCQN